MPKVERIEASELGDSERALWASWRHQRDDLASPYFSPKWTAEVAKVRNDVEIAVLMDDAGRVGGFLPFQRPGRVAVPVGGALSDYHGMIAAANYVCDLPQIMRQMQIARFDFSHIPATQSGFAAFVHAQHSSHVTDLSLGLEKYHQGRREKGSSETKRARKRFRKLSKEVGPVRLETYSQDSAAFEQLLQWKRAQYHQTRTPDVFANTWTRDLVQNLLAIGGVQSFGGALFLLYAGDELMAANYCLADGDVLHAWFIAHDPKWAVYSPGQILFESIITELADTHVREIDLGVGDYRFKNILANSRRRLTTGFVASCHRASLIRDTEYRIRNWAEAFPLGPLSAFPSKAMRRMDVYRGLS